MSQRREALIARYRVISLERLRVIRARLDGVAAGNAEALADVRRELHTLKGDSHLLGQVRIGELAHSCEGRLQDPDLEGAARAVGAALEAVKAALRDEVSDQAEIDEQLRQALAALTAAVPDEPARAPAARDRAASAAEGAPPANSGEPSSAIATAPRAESSRWMYVDAHEVDVVCERLSALHADLGRIHATLRGMLSHARDTMHDVERLRADLDEIVSSAWALRLAPVHPALAELGEHALELAREHSKELRIRIDDGGALVERRLLDEVREPLLHLVRNAVDHGIEPANERAGKPVPAEIALSAEARGDHVVITVADDGRGISVPTVRAIAVARGLIDPTTVLTEEGARELLFLHGFSTRQGATHLSGRGVGLDAVRRRLTAIGGWVSVASNPGGGTRVAIHIPSTV